MGAPVTVVARGEFTVVHQKMERFSRNAWEADRSRNNYSRHTTLSGGCRPSLPYSLSD
jgi:hypothetical protein